MQESVEAPGCAVRGKRIMRVHGDERCVFCGGMNEEHEPDCRHSTIKVILLDTVTGEVAEDSNWSKYWWMDGNGSCDCNRARVFGHYPPAGTNTCLGCKRYVIIAASSTFELCDFNEGYAQELYEQYERKGGA
jgi:hypothetical protein